MSHRHFVQVRRLCIVLLAAIIWGANENSYDLSAYAQVPATRSKEAVNDPKLSFFLRTLRDAVPQEGQQSSQPRQVGSPRNFTVAKLPNTIVDAVNGRQMRITSDQEVQVYIEVDQMTAEYTGNLQSLGVKIEVQGDPQSHQARDKVYTVVPTVQALVPISMIKQVEDLPFVRYVRLPDYGIANTGSVDSQGDALLQANTVRSTLGLDGTSVRIGVISAGIGGVFASGGCAACGPIATNPSPITLGDLPSATGVRNSIGTLISVSGGITAAKSYRTDLDLEDTVDGAAGAEGTALLEVVHDLAPGAVLSFANADTSMHFEQAVDALSAVNDVVVDDISFPGSSFDGTSAVSTNTADALNNDSNQIRAYITSAGDLALDHYQGTYAASGTDGLAITGLSGDLHLFQGLQNALQPLPGVTIDTEGFGPTYYDPVAIIPPQQTVTVYLAWNDPVGASSNDYNLFLVPLSCSGSQGGLPKPPCTISGSPLRSSENPQRGAQDPIESVNFTNHDTSPVSVGIVIQNVNNMALPVQFDLFIFGNGSKQSQPGHNFNTVSGSIPAESDAGGTPASVITVGAINQVQCPSPDNCTGPLEAFSGQGPTQTTPQALKPRLKPDLVAVDGVCITGAGGFGSTLTSANSALDINCPLIPPASYLPKLFYGTSAAVPHAAAVTALLLQAAPCLLYNSSVVAPAVARQNVYNHLTKGNAELLPGYLEPVQNNEVGWGLIDALASTIGVLAVPTAGANQTVSATSSTGAAVVLGGTGADPNNCPLAAIKWSGDCGNGIAKALHATATCPIGVNTVRVGVSNNGISFLPQSQVPYFTVTVTDFVLSASPPSGSARPGASVVYTLNVASTALGAFTYPVALTCSSGLPPGATCFFSPATITPGTSAATATLTIYTAGAGSFPTVTPRSLPNAKLVSLWLGSAMLLAGFTFYGKLLRLNPICRLLVGALLLCISIEIASCSSRKATTPIEYTVTLTGTSGQLLHQAIVSLTVQ